MFASSISSPSGSFSRTTSAGTDSNMPSMNDPGPPSRSRSADEIFFPKPRSESFQYEVHFGMRKWQRERAKSFSPPYSGLEWQKRRAEPLPRKKTKDWHQGEISSSFTFLGSVGAPRLSAILEHIDARYTPSSTAELEQDQAALILWSETKMKPITKITKLRCVTWRDLFRLCVSQATEEKKKMRWKGNVQDIFCMFSPALVALNGLSDSFPLL